MARPPIDASLPAGRFDRRAWLMAARESWVLPVLSRGLLYVAQNTRDLLQGIGPRLLCYDLRG